MLSAVVAPLVALTGLPAWVVGYFVTALGFNALALVLLALCEREEQWRSVPPGA